MLAILVWHGEASHSWLSPLQTDADTRGEIAEMIVQRWARLTSKEVRPLRKF